MRTPLLRLFLLLLLAGPLCVLAVVPHADSSVLATGRWFKLGVWRSGIHQVTYQDLVSLGIDPVQVNPATLRLFGNGTGMLSEVNSAPRIDDLRQVSLEVQDGGDGHFDPGDRMLFYGEAADRWRYDRFTRNFSRQRNLYSDTTWYYLNFGLVAGNRVTVLPAQGNPNVEVTQFDDFAAHELDTVNLIRSGREWYGEQFDSQVPSRTFSFSFPGLDTLSPVRIKWSVVGYAPTPSYFFLSCGGEVVDSLKIDSTDPHEFTRAGRAMMKNTTLAHPPATQDLAVTYRLPTPASRGWLNFLDISCRRALDWHGPQMRFRDVSSAGTGKIARYTLGGAGAGLRVWDISDPAMVHEMECAPGSGSTSFVRQADSLREFVAFDETELYAVKCRGQVPNQNLHAATPATLLIVTPASLRGEADRLAAFHREHNGLTVLVVAINEVYNEFSCGQPDPTAIRDFVKMLYDRDSTLSGTRYLLLFGDGSYDPKDRIPGNNNLVPTFQSVESLSSTASYVTDDYFGIMSDNSGQEAGGRIDIGIGRFPVSTQAEAATMVDKIIRYSQTQYPVASDWRNIITFVADDENQNLHLHQAEEMVSIVTKKYPQFNLGKVYFDAYKLVRIPGGERFPDANRTLNEVVQKGSLIVNYTGHGGESGWSAEQVLTTTDIESWTNKEKMPVFVTATCEFSRFDNPERYTAGELLISRPDGGAIALYSTTRLAFAGLNIGLNNSFYNHLMDIGPDGNYVRMGDLIRISKNANGNNFQLRNFVLLGDPVQNIAFPGLTVRTLTINNLPATRPDTALGLSTVTVTGQVQDPSGQKVTGFNGTVNCKVFDKATTNTTLGNRPGNNESYPENFTLQNSLLFHGDVPVTAGDFTCTFVVPRSIQLQFGKGRLSYFAYSDEAQANGFSDQIVIGGRSASVDPENQGPDISLYLDDRNFIDGGTVGSAAMLLVDLADTNGINALGLGIGHGIEAVLDDDRPNSVVLNDYYMPAYNSFTRGSVTYPLDGLTPGPHTLTLKAWDMYDNSSTATVRFNVPAQQNSVDVTRISTAPNPMHEGTKFQFQVEPYQGDLNVEIRIYNLYGAVVTTLSETFSAPGAAVHEITWNGNDANGRPLGSGLYPYKIIFKATNGYTAEASRKLVIAR